MTFTPISSQKTTRSVPTIEPPRRADGQFLIGDFDRLSNDQIEFLLETGRLNPVMQIRALWRKFLLITDADLFKEILQTRNRTYGKPKDFIKILETGSDKVLFTAEGDDWLWRRRLMQPAFHRKQVAQFCDAIVAETMKGIADWQDGDRLDIDAQMKLITMMIIGRTMFNVDMAGDSAELYEAYRTIGETLSNRIQTAVRMPMKVPTAEHRAFWQSTEIISAALQTIIDDRRQSDEPHNDLLDMMLSMVDVEGGFTENQLIYEMSTIVFAGHETTATTLTWMLYALTQNPAVEEKLLAEIDSVLAGRTPSMADLGELPYLNMVLNETMRTLPVARITSRQAAEDDVLTGYQVHKDDYIFINIYGVHMDERYWDEPQKFDPERFSAERSKGRHKWAFLPFLNGPRKCIGEPLSRTEMQLVSVLLLQRFRFRLPAGAVVEREPAFVMQPKDGLPMILEAR